MNRTETFFRPANETRTETEPSENIPRFLAYRDYSILSNRSIRRRDAEKSLVSPEIILLKRLLPGGGALPRSQGMSAASWGLSRRVQARRHCSINNTQPNRSQHIPFISSTHFILPPVPTPDTDKGDTGGRRRGTTRRMKKTPCPFGLRKKPSPSSANPFFSFGDFSSDCTVVRAAPCSRHFFTSFARKV